MKPLERPDLLARVESRSRSNPVLLLLGPRQCGKTTLAREFAGGRKTENFDLESPADAVRLDQSMTVLESLRGLASNSNTPTRLV